MDFSFNKLTILSSWNNIYLEVLPMLNNFQYIKLLPCFKKKVVTFSFDDGTYQDMEMINLLDALKLKATFNLNSALMNEKGSFVINDWLVNYRIPEDIIRHVYRNHEIAAHTSHHYNLNELTENALKEEIDDDLYRLSQMTKRKVIGFAYPYGIYNEQIIERLKKCNLIYARSTNSSYDFHLPEDWFTYGGTCNLSDSQMTMLVNRWLKLKPKTIKLFYIWGHSYELDMFHEHEKIYHLFSKLANQQDTWYATNGELISYLNAFEKLSYDYSRHQFKNDSSYDLYIQIKQNHYIIPKKGTFVYEEKK